jgi:predicted nucleic acid-binding protein
MSFLLELAVADQCGYIITYNQQDFRDADKFGIRVIGARAFLQEIGELP